METRIGRMLAAVLPLLALCAAKAETVLHGGIVYSVVDQAVSPAKVAVGTGAEYVAAIPSNTEGTVTVPGSFEEDGTEYIVTGILGYAFSNCTKVTQVVLPESIDSIGTYAFYNSGVKTMVLPAKPVSIDRRAFQRCAALETIENLDKQTRLKNGVFRECTALKEVTLGGGFGNYNDDSLQFSRCYALRSAVFEDGVVSISKQMFSEARQLARVVIPSSVRYIGDDAFRDSPVKELTIPQCVIDSGITNVFASAADTLEDIVLSGVTNLTTEAFAGLSNLKSLYIPDGVKVMPEGFFANMPHLESLVLPNGVTGLEAASFANCDALWSKWYAQLTSPAYDLSAAPGDRKIASVTMAGDAALDDFPLRDGKVYDAAIMVENVSASPATLTLPAGYRYVAAAGKKPLTIPPSSLNLITITRTSPDTFFVSRQKLVEIGQ